MPRVWAAVRLILTLHCDESQRLISRSLDETLPWTERWAVRLHFLSCRSCRHIRKQLLFLKEAARRRTQLPVDFSSERFSDTARRRLSAALDAHCRTPSPKNDASPDR
jgi:hypothetical protein